MFLKTNLTKYLDLNNETKVAAFLVITFESLQPTLGKWCYWKSYFVMSVACGFWVLDAGLNGNNT